MVALTKWIGMLSLLSANGCFGNGDAKLSLMIIFSSLMILVIFVINYIVDMFVASSNFLKEPRKECCWITWMVPHFDYVN